MKLMLLYFVLCDQEYIRVICTW